MATATRASFMKVRIPAKPAPRVPSSSAQEPSKDSSQVAEPRITDFFSGRATWKFSRPFSTRGATSRDRPERPSEPGSVRASSTQTSPLPLVMNCLRPLTRQWSPSGTAVVEILPTSEPASGSVIATDPEIPPEASRGIQRSFCSAVPKRRIIMAGPWWKAHRSSVFVQARERISKSIEYAVKGRFAPPSSRGRVGPIRSRRFRPSRFRRSASGWTTRPSRKETPSSSISLAWGATSRAAKAPAWVRISA